MKAMGIDMTTISGVVLDVEKKQVVETRTIPNGKLSWICWFSGKYCTFEYGNRRTDFGIIRSVIRRKWNRSQAIY